MNWPEAFAFAAMCLLFAVFVVVMYLDTKE